MKERRLESRERRGRVEELRERKEEKVGWREIRREGGKDGGGSK